MEMLSLRGKSRFGSTRRFAVLVIVLLVLSSALACSSRTESGKIKVVATIFPLADFVKNVGGDKVEVITLMSAGDSPHTWEPLPEQVKTIAEARLLVINGAGLEFWIEKVVKTAASPDLVVVDTSAIPAMEGALLTADEHEGGVNPHVWSDPFLAQKQVEAIAAALIMVDPANKDAYIANAAAYLAELKSLDEEIRNTTQLFSIRDFITIHPSWTYFARRYGLVEAAVIEESLGGEPSAAYIQQVIDLARELKVKAIFAEPQFSSKAADTIAAESGSQVLFLDAIGGADLPGRDSYINLMRYNVDQMKQAMQ
jgi:zinc transport system substrate-binding protein